MEQTEPTNFLKFADGTNPEASIRFFSLSREVGSLSWDGRIHFEGDFDKSAEVFSQRLSAWTMTPKCEQIRVVLSRLYQQTETWEDVGAWIAYLAHAMACNEQVEVDTDRDSECETFVALMIRSFEPSHFVWSYVKGVKPSDTQPA
jgi:hypothetical protein